MIKFCLYFFPLLYYITKSQTINGQLSVTLDDSRINLLTDYIFTITLVSNDPLVIDSFIEIYLPSDYQSVSGAAYACEVVKWPIAIQNLNCNIGYRVLTVEGGFPEEYDVMFDTDFQFKVFNIKNPAVATYKTGNFSGKILKPDNSQIVGISPSTVQITPGLLAVSLSVNPKTVSTSCDMYLTITPSNPIPLGGWLKFQSSSSTWTRANTLNPQKIFPALTSSCHSVSSNLPSNLYCSDQTSTSLKIFNIVGNSSLNSQFIIKITSVLSPPTTQGQGSFTLTTMTSSGGFLDKSSNNKVADLLPKSILNAQINLQSYENNQTTVATIGLTIRSYIISTDKIVLKIPREVSISSLTKITIQGIQIAQFTVTNDTTHYYLSFSGATITNPVQIYIKLQSIRNPAYVITTGYFSLWTERNNYLIDQVLDAFNYTTVAGQINATLAANIGEAGKQASYTFDLSVTRALDSTNIIKILFPSESFSFSAGSNFSCTSNLSPSCSINCPQANTLQIIQFISSGIHQQMSITISSIKNPSSVGSFPSLIISTYSSTSYLIDQSLNDIFFQTQARQIDLDRISITSLSDVVYARTQLTLKVTVPNNIPSFSKMYVTFPSSLLISSLSCSLTCTHDTDSTYYIILPATNQNQYIAVVFKNIRNPISTAPTTSFQIRIMSSSGVLLQYRNTSIIYSISQPAGLSINLNRNSTQNSAKNVSYQFQLSITFTYSNLVDVVITLAKGIKCVGCLVYESNETHYSVLQDRLFFTANRTLSFTINNLINFYSFQPQDIQIGVFSQNAIFYIAKNSYQIQNYVEGSLSFTHSFINRQLNSLGSFSVTEISSTTQNFETLQIVFGSQFKLSSAFLGSATSSYNITSDDSSKIITLTKLVLSVNDFSISGILTPSFTPSTQIKLRTISNTGFYIDKSNAIYWSTQCNLPCKECQSENTSACLSCYGQEDLVESLVLYLDANNTCNSKCPSKYYDLNGTTCQPCSSSCSNCFQSDIKCLSCPTSLPYLFNYTCYLQCPTGYFQYDSTSPKVCLECDSLNKHCQTCNNFQSCTSCLQNYYFYQNQCLADCPDNITVQNVFSWQCDFCSSNCKECTISGCFSCMPGYLLDNGFCYSSCQTFGLVPHNAICRQCDQTCLTCSNNIYSCLTCNTTSEHPYFLQNKCLQTCPDGYYNDQSFHLCLLCTQPCQYCKNSSVSSCTTCIDTYSLYESTCKSICPDQFYVNGSKCYPCINNCKTCRAQTVCMSCIAGYSLFVQQCVQLCGDGYVSINQKCVECSSNCKTCSLVNFCTSCFNGTFLYEGTCVYPCPDKYFQYTNSTGQNLICKQCPYSCSKCENSDMCTACISGYELSNYTCVSTCDDGYLPVDGICQMCDGSCLTCVFVENNCSACQGLNYSYWNQTSSLGKCYDVCPLSLYYYTQQMNCVKDCPSAYFIETETRTCKKCAQLCQSCTSETFCKQCKSGISIYEGICYQNCPSQAPFSIAGICKSCDILQCYSCNASLCGQCNSGYLIINAGKLCIDSCGELQEYDFQNMQCITKVEPNNTDNSASNNTTDTNTTQIIQNIDLDFVPVPYLIVGAIGLAAVILLHFTHQVSIFRLGYAMIGVLLLCSSITQVIIFISTSTISFSLILNARLLQESLTKNQQLSMLLLLCSIGFIVAISIMNAIIYLYKIRIKRYYIVVGLSVFLGIKIIGGLLCSGICGVNMRKQKNRNTQSKYEEKDFSSNSIQQEYHNYWRIYDFLQIASLLADGLLIAAGVLLVFQYTPSHFQFYGGIQLLILGVIDAILTIFWYVGRNKFKAPDIFSDTGSNQSWHEIKSSQNGQVQIDENSLNQQLTQKLAQTQKYLSRQARDHRNNINESRAYKSELDKPIDVIKLKNEQIEEAINQGIYRKSKNSLAEEQRRKDQQSALDSADKFNYRMKQQQNKENGEEQEKFDQRQQKGFFKKAQNMSQNMLKDQENAREISRDEEQTQEQKEKYYNQIEGKIIFEDFDQSLATENEESPTIKDDKKTQVDFGRKDSLGSLQNPRLISPFAQEQKSLHQQIKQIKVQSHLKNHALQIQDFQEENYSDNKEGVEKKVTNIFQYEIISEDQRHKVSSFENSPNFKQSRNRQQIIYADLESIGTVEEFQQEVQERINHKKPFISLDIDREQYVRDERPGKEINTNFRYNRKRVSEKRQASQSSMPKKIPHRKNQK